MIVNAKRIQLDRRWRWWKIIIHIVIIIITINNEYFYPMKKKLAKMAKKREKNFCMSIPEMIDLGKKFFFHSLHGHTRSITNDFYFFSFLSKKVSVWSWWWKYNVYLYKFMAYMNRFFKIFFFVPHTFSSLFFLFSFQLNY